MDTDLKTRKQVSYEQMNGLLEFLQEQPDLAKGLTRGRRGKMLSLKIWSQCAKKLNALKAPKDGATKDGKGWSKYWCDWKYRVRRKALELRAASDNNRPPPEGMVPLSPMEDCILGLIDENAVNGVVIKSDPLANEDNTEDEEPDDDRNNDGTTPENHNNGTPSKSRGGRKRRHSSRETSEERDGGPSTPPERKPRVRGAGSRDVEDSKEPENDDDASEFLRLEKLKLENSERMLEWMQRIATEVTRLADAMAHIRDWFINNINRNNI